MLKVFLLIAVGFVVAPVQSLARQGDTRGGLEPILLYQGEPHWEMKFLNRAVFGDESLDVATLQRTADGTFMRLFRHEPAEPGVLTGGFPQTREELFAYRGLILSRVEAAAFSDDQLQMIADFVEQRGGGLLMLGSPKSFGEGGYGGTPVADILPLVINPGRPASDPAPIARLKVEPTQEGRSHAVTQIAETREASLERFETLPLLTSVNEASSVRPMAHVLLTGVDEGGLERPVLAWQPAGRGKAVALTVQDTWEWQMNEAIQREDQTHERFWRQLLHWLVEDAPER